MRGLFLFSLAAVVAAFASLNAADVKSAKPVVKIGVVLPISGNNSSLGENGRDGLLLKLREIQPTSKYEYKLIFEDDEFVYSKTAMAIQKFKNIDHVDAIMDLWGQSSYIAVPILKNTNIINLSADRWDEPPAYAYDFSAGCPVQNYVEPTIKVLKELGIKRVGLFTFGERGIQTCATEMKKQMAGIGITVTEEVMASESRDFRTWILKLRESKPDMLVCIGVMPTQEIVLRQMCELGYKLPFCAVGASLWDVNPIYTEGAWFVDPAPSTPEFRQAFQKEFKRDYRYPATQFYDAFTALTAAYEKADGKTKPTNEQIAQALRQTRDLQGATGTIEFLPPNRFKTPLSYYLMVNGHAKKSTMDEVVAAFGKQLAVWKSSQGK